MAGNNGNLAKQDNILPLRSANQNDKSASVEKVLLEGDLSSLTSEERIKYYKTVCDSLGLNPFTKPFDYIKLQGKLVLYAKRDATEQLRKINGISIEIKSREKMGDLYVVHAFAKDKYGRTDESIGAVSLVNLKGSDLANALMKCETKAKRRVTLSLAGLGFLDETEIETVEPINEEFKDISDQSKSDSSEDVINAEATVIEEPENDEQQSTPEQKSSYYTIKSVRKGEKEENTFIKILTTDGEQFFITELTDIEKLFNVAGKYPKLEGVKFTAGTCVETNGCTVLSDITLIEE